MLEAGWDLYQGEYLRHRVELSIKELEFLTTRFSSLVVAASILAGFAFTGKRIDTKTPVAKNTALHAVFVVPVLLAR